MAAEERTEAPPRVVMDADEISRAIIRMAHQVLENDHDVPRLIVVGLPTRGVPLARRLAAAMEDIEGHTVPIGELDVTFYRDDLRRQPTRSIGPTRMPGPIDDAVVILVDDVLYSGRTVSAALEALKDIGRPRAVRLAVLVDRGHRELPIRADVVGKELATASDERVGVQLEETDGVTRVTISRLRRAPDPLP
ncbi:bifunctional pyr operon transcriptional regulator/uracil phosphoribosyltransferase PyrR [Raineyella fluvialis]|uniref:bifunctional pyr operon transcriptional regulator/uracil phosphoribosyltransferase PyrR n=1 Tax=Raineyella fluvialis TaxID=2662261 RepID=UPI001E65B6C8|nr:bifunctional pyr operon transcriptional regulator/uracil phosphoribosyltransferase PyrR [Raineyella fluvialis]